ncbi:MAG TPA: UbiA family prenyltransferase [Chitinophagaceae bacterium]
MLKSIFNFFLFSSLYIALCAVLMVYQVCGLFLQGVVNTDLLLFVFFATICSYNFHWWLTTHSATDSERLVWAVKYKSLHFILYLIGLIGSGLYVFKLREHWFWLGIGAFVTFLYSAPKLPQKVFSQLKRIAVGKTFFLAFVWMYVTTVLPLVTSGHSWRIEFTWFTLSRFLLIYAICIPFDYRDREDDKADGIRSMITYLDEGGIDNLFALSIFLFGIFTLLLLLYGFSYWQVGTLLLPGIIMAALYNYSKRHFSDYFYYFVLDGLMMLSSLLMLIVGI